MVFRMNRFASGMVALLFLMPSAQAAFRVRIVDMGFGSVTNEFGAMTDPSSFEAALRGSEYAVSRISGDELAVPGALSSKTTDLLIVPCGSAWPADATSNLVSFLRGGGSLFTCGGYFCDKPVVRKDGRWCAIDDLKRQPLAAGGVSFALPSADAWSVTRSDGDVGRVHDVVLPDGSNGIHLATPRLLRWDVAGALVPSDCVDGADLISFWAKGDGLTDCFVLGLTHADGRRISACVAVGREWREIRLSSVDFRERKDPKAARKSVWDGYFTGMTRLSVGLTIKVNEPGSASGVSVGGIKFGKDAFRTLRRLQVPRINTRYGKVGDSLKFGPGQIGAFDASFKLTNVTSAKTPSAVAGILPDLRFSDELTGQAAVAIIGDGSFGYGDNHATWRPILEAHDAAGRSRGPVGAIVRHLKREFAGSSWAIFGVDNRDLFAPGAPCANLIEPLVRKLRERTCLSHLRPIWACYRRGESAVVSARITNQDAEPTVGEVRFRLTDENGGCLFCTNVAWRVAAKGTVDPQMTWQVPLSAPDVVIVQAEMLAGGRIRDREESAFVIWTPEIVARGPKLSRKGSLFALDGETRFVGGAQTHWGQRDSYTASSPLAFIRDFKQMSEIGLRWTRCFFRWDDERDKRFCDMVVQLAQKYGIVVYQGQWCGNVMAEGKELDEYCAAFSDKAKRYRDVPGFAIDLRNEPKRSEPPSWSSARKFEHWARRCADAIHAVAPDMPVSTGWMQGWHGGTISSDPLIVSSVFDFTDRHYYGNPTYMPRNLKDVDLRAFGKPLVLGECGAKEHPTYKEIDRVNGVTPEEYSARFRYHVSHVFGLGGSMVLGWHWRDPMEGMFPCGLSYSSGVLREAAHDFASLARAYGSVKLVDNPPDVVVVLDEAPRMDARNRAKCLYRQWALDDVLQYWGANWGKATSSRTAGLKAKLFLRPEELPSDEAELRTKVGQLLRTAGCALARRASDSENLDVMRVKGEGETVWVVWNGGRETETFSRGGTSISVKPQYPGMIRERD